MRQGSHHSPETLAKLSATKKGEKNPMYGKTGKKSPMKGKHLSLETRAKMSVAQKGEKNWNYGKIGEKNPKFGKHRSLETKAKLSIANKGKHLSPETKAKISESRKGKHHTPETRLKLSVALKGRYFSPDHRAKLSVAFTGKCGKDARSWKGDKAALITGHGRAQKMYPCPKGIQRHHVDGNPLNNSPENIMFLTNKQHMELDGRLERLMAKGYETRFKKK